MLEHRYAPEVLTRQEPSTLETVTGMAIPYEQWETIGYVSPRAGGEPVRRREKAGRGAFERSVQESLSGETVIRAFMAHHPERILGRTDNGTLRLRNTDSGLMFDLDPPNTQDGRDAVALIQRGDLGASVGFLRKRDSNIQEGVDAEDGTRWSVLLDVDLREISLTANPAYRSTFVRVASAAVGASRSRVAALEWLYGLPTST